MAVPVADFSGSPLAGNADLTVEFIDSSTNTPTDWLWDFGDGNASTVQNPTHTYEIAGVFTVSLNASNVDGDDDEVKSDYVDVEMVADFSATPQSGGNPLEVTFSDASIGAPDTWLWNFGDTNTSTLQNPVHEYTDAGTYTVSLTSTLGAKVDTKTVVGFVVVAAAAPVAGFTVSPDTGEAPISIAFTDVSLGDPTTRWRDFGDGFFSNLEAPSHIYYKAGVYSPSLTVTNTEGNSSITASGVVTIVETTPGQTNRENSDQGRSGVTSFPPLGPSFVEGDDRTIILGTR